jgi:ATP-binding cassette subfamily B protein
LEPATDRVECELYRRLINDRDRIYFSWKLPVVCDDVNLGTIFKFGRRYLVPRKTLLLFYIIGFLLAQTIVPAGIALSAGTLTNYFQKEFSHRTAAQNGGGVSIDESARKQSSVDSKSRVASLTGNQLVSFYALWVGLILLGAAVGFGQKYVASKLAGSVSNHIRRDVFSALLKRSISFFYEKGSDQLVTVATQFPLQVQMALQALLVDPLLNLIGMTILGLTLYNQLTAHAQQNGPSIWLLFGAVVLLALASPWLVNLMSRKLERSARGLQEQNLLIASLVGGALKAPEEIQSMCAEPLFDRKHTAALHIALQRRLEQTVVVEKLNLLNRLPGDFVLISLLGLAVYLALTGSSLINGGIVIALFLLTPQFMGAVQGLSGIPINARLNAPALEAIAALLDDSHEFAAPSPETHSPPLDATLEARQVNFGYAPNSKKILNQISFALAPGKITGLIARAGQGKTTFFRLALRFYELEHGEILIGGIPHTRRSLDSLRQHIVLMHQNPVFFYDTIRENFLVSNPRATDTEIRDQCEQTRLWQILLETYGPEPLNRQFFAGSYLSGGQKKLFALTRCLLRNPTILFLDEPTTGMDSEEKLELVKIMRQACSGKTVLTVDHDLVGWQVLFCDHFVVLNEGKIEEQGTAAELLSRVGLFKSLFDDQAEGFHKMAAIIDAKTSSARPTPS